MVSSLALSHKDQTKGQGLRNSSMKLEFGSHSETFPITRPSSWSISLLHRLGGENIIKSPDLGGRRPGFLAQFSPDHQV